MALPTPISAPVTPAPGAKTAQAAGNVPLPTVKTSEAAPVVPAPGA